MSTNKKLLTIFIIFVVFDAGLLLYYFVFNSNPVISEVNTYQSIPIQKITDIAVESLDANQQSASPLGIEGQVTGPWYFEGVFPVVLLDANGKEIARTQARAQGEWTTPNFVPFKAELTFTKPETSTGIVRFMNDNPSGLAKNQKLLTCLLNFSLMRVFS